VTELADELTRSRTRTVARTVPGARTRLRVR
jgi:hypothetical protein